MCILEDFFFQKRDGWHKLGKLPDSGRVFVIHSYNISRSECVCAQNDDFLLLFAFRSFHLSSTQIADLFSFWILFFTRSLSLISFFSTEKFLFFKCYMCAFCKRSREKKYKGWRIYDRMRERERGSKNMKEKKYFDALFIYILIRP